MDVRAKLAKNLISLRQAKGWSQEDLADEAGLHRTYVSGIERKVRNPTITVLERLAKALKLAPGRLLD
ncbi:MAG: helix-turn-helix transcriptional regulator [Hyphomonadaceae bacterium]|jgi:transcriptional regulator with XRE-family HTH domain|nr:helix-turn-helix transcriptional regulator [Hyphomonadaceae bacterium]